MECLPGKTWEYWLSIKSILRGTQYYGYFDARYRYFIKGNECITEIDHESQAPRLIAAGYTSTVKIRMP